MEATTFTRSVGAVPAPSDPVRWFARWVAESCRPGMDVLDIGAGCDRSGSLRAIRRRRPHLVGVDPADSIWSNPALDERFQQSLEDFACTHEASFDVAFAVFVLEHVADPPAFSSACARVLRPGGAFLGLTVNKYQYFGFATWLTTRLGVTDRALAVLDHGHHHGHDHHVPTVYRMNSPGQVAGHLREAGFGSVDFRMFDKPEMYAWYLPSPLRPWSTAWSATVYRLGTPRLMGHLAFRAIRRSDEADGGTMPETG
jgi:ubiquinone/menaquinone biosynthesis C-methylase UbiE